MKAWLQQNWKLLAAAIAVFVIVILLYLYQRSRSSGAASTISFPGSSGATDGGASGPLPLPGSSTPATNGPGIFATWHNQLHNLFVDSAGTLVHQFYDPSQGKWVIDSSMPRISGLPAGSQVSVQDYAGQFHVFVEEVGGAILHLWYQDGFGWSQETLPAGEVPSTPASAPAATSGRDVVPQVPTGPAVQFGTGGPGPLQVAGNLQQAALSAERSSHQVSLRSTRAAGRWRHDATQALRESRRIFQESRGAAPVRGG